MYLALYHLIQALLVLVSEVAMYIAGFPCTPYSSLGGRACLEDPNARQLYACVKRAKATRPKATWPIKVLELERALGC